MKVDEHRTAGISAGPDESACNICVCVLFTEWSVFWDIMNVIQKAQLGLAALHFMKTYVEAGCYVQIIYCVHLPVKYMLVNYILCIRCKTICYSSAAGMQHIEAIAEQISQERILCVLFLFCGLVRFKPPLCSGINWKAAAELQLVFCAFWDLPTEVLLCESVPLLWLLSVWHGLDNIPLS